MEKEKEKEKEKECCKNWDNMILLKAGTFVSYYKCKVCGKEIRG